ncbi:PH domain-containing protein [Methylobacterium sp. J-026]|nr:PH domain-containing protein [Methylobacterium sp. J-026]
MSEGELLIAFSSGLHNGTTWLIVLTDQRVLLLDKGMIYGLKQINIPLDKVNAVSGRTGLFFGQIFIEDGATTYSIENTTKTSANIFTNKVREAIEARRQGGNQASRPQPATPIPSAEDRIARLERLAALRDKGVLTPAEFETEKSKILSS